MELKHLRTFVCAIEQTSFTRAAAVLHITQAAVSQHVAALEKELQTELFHRQGRSVQLTESGQRLREYARRILDLADEAVCKVGGSDRQVCRTLCIAASTVPAEWILPDLLARFHAEFPDVRESLIVSDSKSAAGAVDSGSADVGFIGELPASSELEARPIAADQLLLVVSPQHAWAAKSSISVNQLSAEPLIIREQDSGSRHCLELALEQHGVRLSDLTVALEVNSNDAIRAAVASRVGVAFLSANSVARDLADGNLATTRVRGLKLHRQLYLITRRSGPPSEPLRQFLSLILSWTHNQR